jgi:hypothetical protein
VVLAQLALAGAAWAGFVTALGGRLDSLGVAWPWLPLAVAGTLLAVALGLLGLVLGRLQPPEPPERRAAAVRTLESTHAA